MAHSVDAHGTPDHTPGVQHENRDISTRIVVIFAAVLVGGAVVIHFVIWLLYLFFGSMNDRAYPRQYPLAQVGAPAQPPAPRLQTKPREELKQFRREEDEILGSYGWVDKNTGLVHIPIDRAMALTLEQGLPTRSQAARPLTEPEKSSSGQTSEPRERD